MTFIIFAVLIGLALGFASFYYQELFLAAMVMLGVIFYFLLRPYLLLAPLVGSEVSETGRSEGYIQDILNTTAAAYDLLPSGADTALFLLPICVLLGRCLTWAHYTAFPDYALPRTDAEHRAETMKKFSFKRPPS